MDLPGTYSLFAKADDERVTQRELLDPELQPDAVWIVLDSAHVRSSLFLALQVLEMGFPATVIINRTDATDVRLEALEAWLGVPAFPSTSRRNERTGCTPHWQGLNRG